MKMKKPAVEAELLQRVSFCMRRGRDSNPRNAFGVYTLSLDWGFLIKPLLESSAKV